MTNPPDPAPARRLGWTRWLLLASLVLNGLLGGYLIGERARPDRPPRGALPVASIPPNGIVPEPLREAVRGELRRDGHDMRGHIDAAREARRAVREALLAEPFDEARLRAALGALRTRQQTIQEDLQNATVAAVAKLSPAERRRIADWQPPERGHHMRGR